MYDLLELPMNGPHCRGPYNTPEYERCRFCGDTLNLRAWSVCKKSPQVTGPLPCPGQIWEVVEYEQIYRTSIVSVSSLGDYHTGLTGTRKNFYAQKSHVSTIGVVPAWPPGRLIQNAPPQAYPWVYDEPPTKVGLVMEIAHAKMD